MCNCLPFSISPIKSFFYCVKELSRMKLSTLSKDQFYTKQLQNLQIHRVKGWLHKRLIHGVIVRYIQVTGKRLDHGVRG